jgi:Zn-finger nucleic acid-binding protein
MDVDAKVCPHCDTDLRASRIPQDAIDQGLYGPPTTEPKYYYNTIGHVERGVYDGVLYWSCPACGGKWHRFPEGHYLRTRAEKFVNA